VEEALKAAPRVRAVAVDLDKKLASIEVEAPSLMDAMAMLPGCGGAGAGGGGVWGWGG
jgi:hypothetical protein